MKKLTQIGLKHTETFLETDIDESYSPSFPYNTSTAPIHKKKKRKLSKKINMETPYSKILRFSLKSQKQTLRVPCYREEFLNMPIRFTKKLNAMEVDNDVETDQEMVEEEIERCCGWLKDAIKARCGESS